MLNARDRDRALSLLSHADRALIKGHAHPAHIQDLISAIPQNFDTNGPTCMTPRGVLESRRAHCIEGAILAAFILWCHGERPLLMDLSANERDEDHVIALFRRGEYWGAISKGNHAFVRFRDPIYRSPRELALSYFNEYFNIKGEKTLRTFSRPFDLRTMSAESWLLGEDAWPVAYRLCEIAHNPFLPRGGASILRKVEDIELRAARPVVFRR